jgi:hypothetical protein
VVACHGADPGNQFLADVLGAGLLVHLGGEVVTALGRVLVEGTLQEVQAKVDLPVELLLANPEDFMFFAHKSAYVYAHIFVKKRSLVKGLEQKNRKKPRGAQKSAKLLPGEEGREGVRP